MYLSMVCGMFVCVSLSVNVCMFTVSNALLMSNATPIAQSVSTLDFNFERAVEGSILIAGKRLSLKI